MMFPIRCAAVLALVLAARSAHAQATSEEADLAFRQGMELKAANKLFEACEQFARSQQLEPRTTTLFVLADCREKTGKLGSAWRLFVEGERQTRQANDANLAQMNAVAVARIADIVAHASKLTVRVPVRVPGLEIHIGTESLAAADWDRPLPTDAGTHELTARAPGYDAWSGGIDVVGDGDVKSIVVQLHKTPDKPVRQLGKPIAVTAGATALLGGAVGFALWGNQFYDKSKREPDDAKQASLYESANTRRHVAIGLASTGVACAAVATWLWLRSGKHEEPRRRTGVQIGPMAIQLFGEW